MVQGVDAGKRRQKSGCEDISGGLEFDQAAGFGDGGEEEMGEPEGKKVRGWGRMYPLRRCSPT